MLKRIIVCCVLILSLFAVGIDIGYLYYRNIGDTETVISTNNIGNQVATDLKTYKMDSLTESQKDDFEDRCLFEINVYENDDKTGFELQEVNMNYFTSYDLDVSSYRSTGMQYIGDYTAWYFKNYRANLFGDNLANQLKNAITNKDQEVIDEYVLQDFYYYDTTLNTSFNGGRLATTLNRNQEIIIKIDEKPYAIKLDGMERIYQQKGILGLNWFDKWIDVYYNYGSLFQELVNCVKTNSNGYGSGYFTPDLSKYFSIKSFDENGKKFTSDATSDLVKNYAVVKYNYYKEGAQTSEQSLFNLIQCNSSYGLTDFDASYASDEIVLTLSEQDLNYRYSETYGGYFASLSLSKASEINDLVKSAINLHIDLDSTFLIDYDYNLIGFDMNAFEGVKIKDITIESQSEKDFHLLTECLVDTRIKTLTHSDEVNLIIADDAFNSIYTEVIE